MGELHASYLDYQKAASGGGLVTMSSSAVLDATDSTFGGAPDQNSDYISSYAAALVHVAYSTIVNAHCAFHFDDVTQFEIDHVTAGSSSPLVLSIGSVVYGAMLYGSGAGPNTISNSNFMDTEMGLDLQGGNGPITITNTYTSGGPERGDADVDVGRRRRRDGAHRRRQTALVTQDVELVDRHPRGLGSGRRGLVGVADVARHRRGEIDDLPRARRGTRTR